MLGNRLKKRYQHLRKWAKRQNIDCFRLYEKDIPEFPCIVDWYDGEAVAWVMSRTRDESEADELAFRERVYQEIVDGLGLSPDRVHLKERFRQRSDGPQQYQRVGEKGEVKIVNEQNLRFEVNLSDFLDTGLFLDHRVAREWVRQSCSGLRVLNLFAYTGSFSVYALAGGAHSVTTVDMSHTYGDWAMRNLELNDLDLSRHQLVLSDCLKWLRQAKKEKLLFDLIICDPPTFSNSKRMEEASFSVDRDHPWLISDALSCLERGGRLFFSNNSKSFKMDCSGLAMTPSVEEVSHQSVPEDFRNRKIHRSWWIQHASASTIVST